MKRDGDRSRRKQPRVSIADMKPTDEAVTNDLRIEPIRLNKKRLLSLDAMQGASNISTEEPRVVPQFNWGAVAAACGMTPIETRLFLLHWRDGVPTHQLHFALQIDFVQAAQVYAACCAKLGLSANYLSTGVLLAPMFNSLRPAYRERMQNGVRRWALAGIDPTFQEILAAERSCMYLQKVIDPICARKVGTAFTMNTNSLRQNLADEKSKLARLGERMHSSRLSYEKAERDLDKAMTESRGEQAAAVLAEKEYTPTAETRKRLTLAQNAVAHMQADLDATGEALRLQQIRCGELEAQINARRHEEFLASAKEVLARIRRTVPNFSEDVFKLQSLAYEHGESWPTVMALLGANTAAGFSADLGYIRLSALLAAASALQTVESFRAAAIGD